MTTIIRCGVAVVGLFVATAAIAAENAAAGPKNALDSLLTQLNTVNQDRDMMTAKKAPVAAEAMEKFNQQCRGKPLVVRLKIQDVAPNDQGQCLTANRPDLEGVQFTGKFQSNLSNAEVMSVTKDSVLAVTGMVRAANRPPTHFRSSDVFRPGSNITFSLRANPSCQICLDNVSYRIEAESKTTPDVRSASSHGGSSSVSSHGGSAFVSSYGGSAQPTKPRRNRRTASTKSSCSSSRAYCRANISREAPPPPPPPTPARGNIPAGIHAPPQPRIPPRSSTIAFTRRQT